ncbi:uncharacterized protein LOC118739923 [Rhagoletis pomonella]|uniref:uncharacterized protein LOC118739923 n=1 Tax=Rhagoletis pomonella TaxID=28610 RepID=UPI00177D714C|nr:uncharacterized protein LOC118739923 [Rhagoletis pomonella]
MSRFLQVLLAAVLVCSATHARQLRNNRYSARIEEAPDNADGGVVAVVKQVYPTPYPAAGYRPGRAFNLPGEDEDAAEDGVEEEEGSGLATTTTELPEDLLTTTITEAIDTETTTLYNWVASEISSDEQGRAVKAPYPAAGWRPSRAFLLPTEVKAAQEAEAAAAVTQNDSDVVDALPTSTATPLAPFTTQLSLLDETATEVDADNAVVPAVPQSTVSRRSKAPYPPSGWRPNRAFLLPTEVKVSANQESALSVNEPEAESPVSPADKAGHPACGVSDNPVAPKPEEGAKENPDAERVYVTANLDPAVVNSPLTLPVLLRSERLISPPIYVPAGRSFAYSATVQSWR